MENNNGAQEPLYEGLTQHVIPIPVSRSQYVACLTVRNCQNIRSLENVDQYRRLQRLVAVNNAIANASRISALKDSLTHIDLSYNYIAQVHDIMQCTNLTHLNLANNSISAFDVPNRLPKLAYLNLKNNRIGAADFSRLPALRYLNLAGNTIQRLRPLHLPDGLVYLSVQSNNLSDRAELLCLQDLGGLQFLFLADNAFRTSTAELEQYIASMKLNKSLRVYLNYAIDDEEVYTDYLSGLATASLPPTHDHSAKEQETPKLDALEDGLHTGPQNGGLTRTWDEQSETYSVSARHSMVNNRPTSAVLDRITEQLEVSRRNNEVQDLRQRLAQQSQIIQRLQLTLQKKDETIKNMSLSHSIEQFRASYADMGRSQAPRQPTDRAQISLSTLNQVQCESMKYRQINELQAKYQKQLRQNVEAQETIRRLTQQVSNLERHRELETDRVNSQKLLTARLEKEIIKWKGQCEQLSKELRREQEANALRQNRVSEQTQTVQTLTFNRHCQTEVPEGVRSPRMRQQHHTPPAEQGSHENVTASTGAQVNGELAGTAVRIVENVQGQTRPAELPAAHAPPADDEIPPVYPASSPSQTLNDGPSVALDPNQDVVDQMLSEMHAVSEYTPSEGSQLMLRPRKKKGKKGKGRLRTRDEPDVLSAE